MLQPFSIEMSYVEMNVILPTYNPFTRVIKAQSWQGRFDNMSLNPHNYHKETQKYEDSTLKSLDERIGHLILMLSNGQMPVKK